MTSRSESSPTTSRSQASDARADDPQAGQPGQTGSREPPPDSVKVLPPSGPVDVPTQPNPVARSDEDEAAAQGRAQADTETESNWADGSAPQPRAKNARSSLF